MPIQVLPETLVNQIAAGEVIVRPANAVKELIENSLDAGAQRITVEIGNGARDIRVTDDGSGMSPEDAALALVRHATSKIRVFEDLYSLKTRGFRGEALASIAAVGRVRLLTRRREDLAGTEVICEGGAPPSIRQAGAPPGTDIRVRDLFYNTPARLKFLKAAASETTAILTTTIRLAIARPDVGFRVTCGTEDYLDLPPSQPWDLRIATLLGITDAAQDLLPVDFERNSVRVRGYVVHPRHSSRDRRRQHFLLDGRPISSRTLAQVLQEAYRGVIMVGKFPWAVLDITVPDGEVDINVHPSKEEVRFRREPAVTSALYRGVQEALRRAHIVPEADLGTSTNNSPGAGSTSPSSQPASAANSPLRQPYQPEMLSWAEQSFPPTTPRTRPDPIDLSNLVRAHGPVFGSSPRSPQPSSVSRPDPTPWSLLPGTATPEAIPSEATPASPPPAAGPHREEKELSAEAPLQQTPTPPTHPTRPDPISAPPAEEEDAVFRWLHESGTTPEVLGQVADCYIVARAGETLLLIDQHAAHERIQYARLTAATAPVASQPLLFPLTVEVPVDLVPALNRALPLLAWYGFETSHFGGQTFMVQSTPADLMPYLDASGLMRDLLEDLAATDRGGRPLELHDLRDRIITRMSCRSAVKAGQTLHIEEMRALIRDLATTPLGTNCPHGRPTMVTLTRHTLDKLFKRIL